MVNDFFWVTLQIRELGESNFRLFPRCSRVEQLRSSPAPGTGWRKDGRAALGGLLWGCSLFLFVLVDPALAGRGLPIHPFLSLPWGGGQGHTTYVQTAVPRLGMKGSSSARARSRGREACLNPECGIESFVRRQPAQSPPTPATGPRCWFFMMRGWSFPCVGRAKTQSLRNSCAWNC